MRLFVYEFLTAGGNVGPAAASLLMEGWAMLSALLEDFSRIPGAELATMLGAAAAGKPPLAGVSVHDTEEGEEETLFHRLAAAADGTLVVAPEIDDILATRLEWVERANGHSLGSTPAAARLAGDKLRLAEHLRDWGIPTPPTAVWPAAAPSFPAVSKPRRGAGSQATFLTRDEDELRRAAAAAGAEWQDDVVVQPYIPGVAVSVAFLIGPGQRWTLPAAAQHLSPDGRFHYQGGSLPLAPALAERAGRLAARAVDAVEGLRGYVGVDLVLGPADDGAGDAVIEINPRLTTSYIGLRALARFNLAEAMLAVAAGQAPPTREWRADQVRFTADGRLVK